MLNAMNNIRERLFDLEAAIGLRRRREGATPIPGTPRAADVHGRTVRILIAVPTTGSREQSLLDCVVAINNLELPPGVEWELILLQNGSDDVAPGVAKLRDDGPTPLRVVLEPRKGIPFARNRAILDAIETGADYLAFIDDDAAPDSGWLVEATRVLFKTGADAVTGPQAPLFPPDAPTRLSRAAIFQALHYDPESPCRWAASNNVIFSVPLVRDKGLRFNESFETGGSDKEFFLRFTASGGVIRWAAEAIVREPVVPERLSIRWAVSRSWRLGATGFQIERSLRGASAAAATCIGKGGAYMLVGIASLPVGLLPGRAGLIDGLCFIAHGAGFVLGIIPRFRLRKYV